MVVSYKLSSCDTKFVYLEKRNKNKNAKSSMLCKYEMKAIYF